MFMIGALVPLRIPQRTLGVVIPVRSSICPSLSRLQAWLMPDGATYILSRYVQDASGCKLDIVNPLGVCCELLQQLIASSSAASLSQNPLLGDKII